MKIETFIVATEYNNAMLKNFLDWNGIRIVLISYHDYHSVPKSFSLFASLKIILL